jgi:hypothetical protein
MEHWSDPDPGSGAFLPPDPGSGMEQWSDPDPGSGINHPGSATLVVGNCLTFLSLK